MESKNTMKSLQERSGYVPVKVAIIEMAQDSIICQSPESIINPYTNGGTY